MNDLETRIRRVLEEDAAHAPRVPRAPVRMRTRVRHRQVGTGLTATITVLAVFAGTFAGFRLLSPAPPSQVPADTHTRPVYERTATIEGFTVTSPSDWYLIDEWPGSREVLGQTTLTPAVLPILQASSFDPGLEAPICRGNGVAEPIPTGGLVLAVGVTLAGDRPSTNDQPCGTGNYARATIDRGGSPLNYFVWWNEASLQAEPAASDTLDAIRTGVLSSLDQLSARTDLPGIQFPGTETPGYVLWGGTNGDDGSTFTIEARPEDPNIDLKLIDRYTDGTYSEGGFAAFDVPPKPIDGGFMGAVIEGAASVEFRRTEGGPPGVALLADLPPSLDYPADAYYFPSGYPTKIDSFEGKLVALASDGSVITESTATDTAIASGEVPGTSWLLRLVNASEPPSVDHITLALEATQGAGSFTKQTWDMSAADGIGYRTFAFAPYNGNSTEFLIYGVVPPDTSEVVVPQEVRDLTIPSDKLVPIVDNAGVTVALAFARDDAFIPVIGPIRTLDANGNLLASEAFDPPDLVMTYATPHGAVTATGSFGVDWRIDTHQDGLTLTLGDRSEDIPWPDFGAVIVRPTGVPAGSAFDALAIVWTDLSVNAVCVTSEGRWCGRWIPARDAPGHEARMWVVELPGGGTGQLWFDDKSAGSISWP
jgi:hypothetical protein